MTTKEFEKISGEIGKVQTIKRKFEGLEKFLKSFDDYSDVRVEINPHCLPVEGFEIFNPIEKSDMEMLKIICFNVLKNKFERELEKLKAEFENMQIKIETNF